MSVICSLETELFNKIYDETFDDIRRFVAIKCSDTSYISDILQEVYLELYRMIIRNGQDYAKDIRAVLYKIAKRKVYRYYSLKDKLKIFIPIDRVNSEEDEYISEVLLDDNDFEDNVISLLESEKVWNIISEYPADVRKIFYLFFYEEMSHSQIAKELNCSLSNVKNKLYRTLNEIREKGKVYD